MEPPLQTWKITHVWKFGFSRFSSFAWYGVQMQQYKQTLVPGIDKESINRFLLTLTNPQRTGISLDTNLTNLAETNGNILKNIKSPASPPPCKYQTRHTYFSPPSSSSSSATLPLVDRSSPVPWRRLTTSLISRILPPASRSRATVAICWTQQLSLTTFHTSRRIRTLRQMHLSYS